MSGYVPLKGITPFPAASSRMQHDAVRGKTVIQRHGDQIVVQNPPMPPLTTQELDRVYALPYERMYHPSYAKEGGGPGNPRGGVFHYAQSGLLWGLQFLFHRLPSGTGGNGAQPGIDSRGSEKADGEPQIQGVYSRRRADLPQISEGPPAKSRKQPGCAKGKNVWPRNRVLSFRWITANIWRSCEG